MVPLVPFRDRTETPSFSWDLQTRIPRFMSTFKPWSRSIRVPVKSRVPYSLGPGTVLPWVMIGSEKLQSIPSSFLGPHLPTSTTNPGHLSLVVLVLRWGILLPTESSSLTSPIRSRSFHLIISNKPNIKSTESNRLLDKGILYPMVQLSRDPINQRTKGSSIHQYNRACVRYTDETHRFHHKRVICPVVKSNSWPPRTDETRRFYGKGVLRPTVKSRPYPHVPPRHWHFPFTLPRGFRGKGTLPQTSKSNPGDPVVYRLSTYEFVYHHIGMVSDDEFLFI